jgi:mono/diheme cytochrome c family protein
MLALNDPDNLAYRLIDGMRVGHDEMPRFDFDIRAADALVAYLGTISGPPDR